MVGKRFVIGDVLGFGWQVMKLNLWFFVGVVLVAGILEFAPDLISDHLIPLMKLPEPTAALINLPLTVVGWFISVMVGIGFIKIALGFCDSQKPPFKTLFDYRGCFWRYVNTTILQYLIILGGFLLLIVPGIIWSIKYSMATYFVIDKGLSPVQALKASGRTTMGVKWQLCGFDILCALIVLLGLLCLGVGIFAALPTVMVANALVYRHLLAQTPELAQLGIDTPPSQP